MSLCDCDFDLLDIRFTDSPGFDVRDIPSQINIENASGLIDYSTPVTLLGIALCAFASRAESQRRKKARTIAARFFNEGSKWD